MAVLLALLAVLLLGLVGLDEGALVLEEGLGHEDLVLVDVLAELGQDLLAFDLDGREPAKVVEPKVVVDDVLLAHAQGRGGNVDDGDGHVADVDDARVGAQHAAGLGDDGSWVGVVEDPVVLLGVLLNVVDELDHREDGAHAVGEAAAAAGLLANAAVAQRDLLVLLAHRVAAHAHLRKDEGGVGEGLGLVGGHRELDVQAKVLVEDPVNEHADLALALLVDVVEANLVDLELVGAQGDGLDDARGERGAATAKRDDHGASTPFLEGRRARRTRRPQL